MPSHRAERALRHSAVLPKHFASGPPPSASYTALLSADTSVLTDYLRSTLLPDYLRSAFFILGLGVLLPYNAFLSTLDFYGLAFHNVPVGLVFSMCYAVPMFAVAMHLTLSMQSRSSYLGDLIFGFAVLVGITVCMPALAPSESLSGWGSEGLWVYILITAIVGSACAATQSSLFAVSALFMQRESTKAVLSGGALGGIAAAIVNIATLFVYPSNSPEKDTTAAELTQMMADRLSSVYLSFIIAACACFICIAELVWVSRSAPWVDVMERSIESEAEISHQDSKYEPLRDIALEIRDPLCAIVISHIVTSAMYPVLLAHVRGGVGDAPQSWFFAFSVLAFCIGDWIGKSAELEKLGPALQTPRGVLHCALARTIFVPIILLGARGNLPIPDILALIVAFVFGVSNGLVCSGCFELGPEMVFASRRDLVGKVMFLGMAGGLAIGSLSGSFLKSLFIPVFLNVTDAASSSHGTHGFLSRIWPGWRRRVDADPDFPFKVLMEETVGLGLAASGMIAARGEKLFEELDFAFCDIAVGASLNFILVYLLSPTADVGTVASAQPKSDLMKAIDELPANLFASGQYTLIQRVIGFLYKGILFAVCGFGGSIVGTTISQGLITVRRVVARRSGRSGPEKELPNVFVNSAAWAGFMFISSNPRYQAVAGIERLLFEQTPSAFAKIGCGAVRTFNNVAGGAQWVMWARFLGIQSKSDADE